MAASYLAHPVWCLIGLVDWWVRLVDQTENIGLTSSTVVNSLLNVFQAPADLHDKPLNDLVHYLTRPAKKELAKVRAIFRWIAAQDLSKLSSDASANCPPQTPLDYLFGIKNETTSYHTLMQDMCRFVAAWIFADLFCRTCKRRSDNCRQRSTWKQTVYLLILFPEFRMQPQQQRQRTQ